MHEQTPLTVTFRPRRAPRCPLCTAHLQRNAIQFVRGIAFCADCIEWRYAEVWPAVSMVGTELLNNCTCVTHGLRWWTPPNDQALDVFSAVMRYTDRAAMIAQLKNRRVARPADHQVHTSGSVRNKAASAEDDASCQPPIPTVID